MNRCTLRKVAAGWFAALIVTSGIVEIGRAEFTVDLDTELITWVHTAANDWGGSTPYEVVFGPDDDYVYSDSWDVQLSSAATASDGRGRGSGQASARAHRMDWLLPLAAGGTVSLSTSGASNHFPDNVIPKQLSDVYGANSQAHSKANLYFAIESEQPFQLNLVWALRGEGNIAAPGLATNASGSHTVELPWLNFFVEIATYSESTPAGYVSAHSSAARLLWSIEGPLPGLSRESALEEEPVTEVVIGDDLVPVNYSLFTAPALPEYGMSEPVFFNTYSTDFAPQDPEVTELLATYSAGDALFTSNDIAFSSVVMPLAVPDSGFYTLQFGDFSVELEPGEVFDFAAIAAEGVLCFQLFGLGESVAIEDSSSLANYATGLTFAEAGLASFHYQRLPLQGLSGDFNGDRLIDGADFLFWQRHPSIGELSDWSAGYNNADVATVRATPIPEPSLAVLTGTMLAICLARRIRGS